MDPLKRGMNYIFTIATVVSFFVLGYFFLFKNSNTPENNITTYKNTRTSDKNETESNYDILVFNKKRDLSSISKTDLLQIEKRTNNLLNEENLCWIDKIKKPFPVKKIVYGQMHGPACYSLFLDGIADRSNTGPTDGLYEIEKNVIVYPFNKFILVENKSNEKITDVKIENQLHPILLKPKDILAYLESKDHDKLTQIRYLQEFLKNKTVHAHFDRPETQKNDFFAFMYIYHGFTHCGGVDPNFEKIYYDLGLNYSPIPGLKGHAAYSYNYHQYSWHFDYDQKVFFLDYDNKTTLLVRDFSNDKYLLLRTHNFGPNIHLNNYSEAIFADFVYNFERTDEKSYQEPPHYKLDNYYNEVDSRIDLDVDEALLLLSSPVSDYLAKYQYLNDFSPRAYFGSMNFLYAPRFNSVPLKIIEMENFALAKNMGFSLIEKEKEGSIVMHFKYPSFILGGDIRLENLATNANLYLSWDMKNWTSIRESKKNKQGVTYSLDNVIQKNAWGINARKFLYIKIVLGPAKIINNIVHLRFSSFISTQIANSFLPVLDLGNNIITLTYQNKDATINFAHGYNEIREIKPPAAPSSPIYPSNQSIINASDLYFNWDMNKKEKIVNAHFQLSEFEDMRWPLSSNFNIFTSKSKINSTLFTLGHEKDFDNALKIFNNNKEKEIFSTYDINSYKLNHIGLLNPETRYYWRVRVKNKDGLWSKWSNTWSFMLHAPSQVIEVKIQHEKISWKAPKSFFPISHYEIYASNEKGFYPHKGILILPSLRHDKDRSQKTALEGHNYGKFVSFYQPSSQESNFICAIKEPMYDASNLNLQYYRIMAVDIKGNISIPSKCFSM